MTSRNVKCTKPEVTDMRTNEPSVALMKEKTMSPDAKLRMDVYQEGQRAYRAEAACPYTDWRAKTWEKGRAAAQAHAAEPAPTAVPCGVCGVPTHTLSTKRCNRCWELETHIQSNPDLARQILDAMETYGKKE